MDDPGEKINLANDHPEMVEELTNEYLSWYNSIK